MDTNDIKLGFSTGVLHKTYSAKEALKVMRDLGYDTVELGFVKLNRVEEGRLDELTANDLKEFKYVSLHAPTFGYGNNSDTQEFFKRLKGSIILELYF